VAYLSQLVTDDVVSIYFAILAASASYIAVPAAMKIRRKKANPGLYLPMALATFPLMCFWNAYIPVYYSKFLRGNSCTEKQKKSK
jgi:hypothetical protein